MDLSPSWEAASCAATHKLSNILWNPKFITVFTRALHWSLSWAIPIQSIPFHPFSQRSILILSTHLRCGISSGLFPSSFPTNILCAFVFSPIRATYPTHLVVLLVFCSWLRHYCRKFWLGTNVVLNWKFLWRLQICPIYTKSETQL
jgi:hypothetical protein